MQRRGVIVISLQNLKMYSKECVLFLAKITKSPSFKSCMEAFDNAMKELKMQGKGCVKNHKEINEEGI